jgi:hypothetical protein
LVGWLVGLFVCFVGGMWEPGMNSYSSKSNFAHYFSIHPSSYPSRMCLLLL